MTAKRAPAVHRARLEVDERRAQLVALGLEQFARRAYDEVSIEDVARAAGISKGLLYHYFPTKRDYYVATLREAAAGLLARTQTPIELPPMDRLAAGLDAYLDYVEEHGPAYAALMRGGIGSDPEVAAVVEQTRLAFVDRLVAESPIEQPTAMLRVALRGWLGMVEATSLDWYDERPVSRARLRDLLAATLPHVITAAVQLAQLAQDEEPAAPTKRQAEPASPPKGAKAVAGAKRAKPAKRPARVGSR
jgi:AcrR family transcriptional regulator